MISFEAMSENFKGTYPNAQCTIDCTEYFYQRHSSPTIQFKVPFIQAKSTIFQCHIRSNLSSNFY